MVVVGDESEDDSILEEDEEVFAVGVEREGMAVGVDATKCGGEGFKTVHGYRKAFGGFVAKDSEKLGEFVEEGSG